MKRINICLTALLSLMLVSCNEDFIAEYLPQTSEQESVLMPSDVTVKELTSEINIDDLVDSNQRDSIMIPMGIASVAKDAMPANTILKGTVQFSATEDFANPITISAESMAENDTVFISPAALQQAYYENITHSPKTKTVYTRTYLETVTNGSSVAIVGDPTYFNTRAITLTPHDTHIVLEKEYYYLGSQASDQTYKFTNSGADPYDDPVFSCVVPAVGDGGWHWFKIAPASAYNADGTMDWGKETTCICPMTSDDTALEGKCTNGKLSWHLLENENIAKFKITVNVMDMTYTITAIPPVPEYYMVGRQNAWGLNTGSAFYPVSKSTATYTSYFTGAWDCRISNLEQINTGNWNNFGAAEENGSCTELVENTGKCIMSPEAGYYTLTVDFDAMKYSWEKVNVTESYSAISLIGVDNDWNTDHDFTQVEGSGDLQGNATHNWVLKGMTISSDCGVKVRANHDWAISWGMTPTKAGDYMYGTGTTANGPNISIAPGTYDIYFNDITGQMFFIKR